jgi:hypothetical protein
MIEITFFTFGILEMKQSVKNREGVFSKTFSNISQPGRHLLLNFFFWRNKINKQEHSKIQLYSGRKELWPKFEVATHTEAKIRFTPFALNIHSLYCTGSEQGIFS